MTTSHQPGRALNLQRTAFITRTQLPPQREIAFRLTPGGRVEFEVDRFSCHQVVELAY